MARIERETKSDFVSARVEPGLVDRVRAAVEGHPYRLTISQVVERGLILALAELEASK